MSDISSVVRGVYKAYETKDRAAIEALLAHDFHFTSPLDNRLDRATYFKVCWPNSGSVQRFDLVSLLVDGDKAFVTYEAQWTHKGSRAFRNTEVFTVRNGKVVEVEVYFGWSIPHEAPAGSHIDPK
jgi:ketosteroid isomerase-like protein